MIQATRGNEGALIIEENEIKHHVVKVFKNIYSRAPIYNGNERKEFTERSKVPRLSHKHLEILNKPFSKREVEDAVFQMEGNKASGPDGFPAKFF